MSALLVASLLVAALAFALFLRHAIAHDALHRRPILLVAAILGVLPAMYVGLVLTGAVADAWLRFERPLLVIVGAIVVPWMARRLLGLSPRQSAFRRALTEASLMASTLAASLALPGPELGKALDRMTLLVVIDRSRSIDLVPDAEARIEAELAIAEQGMREGDRIGTIVFADGAAIEDPPRPKASLPSPQRIELGREATHLSASIKRALEEAKEETSTRVVLVTDGIETRGDALRASAAAVALEIPIDTLPLDQRQVPDLRLESLRMPNRADENEPIELRISTFSSARAEIEVRIKRNGELLRRGRTTVEAGEDVIRLREVAPSSGLYRYDVELTSVDPALDFSSENNEKTTFLRVRGEAFALVVDGDEKGDFIAKALEEAAFRVDVGGPARLPSELSELIRYDLVVLSDVRAALLSEAQLEMLASYARDLGGGLVLMGGDRSMGPGGYGRTPVEEVSPVSFDVKNERKRASLAQIIAIDYSGSMGMTVGGGLTKLALANEAAARSASLLGPGDRIGVAHIDTALTWTVPLSPATDAEAIARRIRATQVGGGGIYMDPTLREAYAALDGERVALKHLLVFADGDDAERIEGCRALVANALSRGITTSVVALGRGKDLGELEVLSRLGSGRFYLVEDATRLPAVFAEETVLAARSAINEVDFHPAAAAPGAPIRGVDFGEAPALRGYVVTTPKSRATVHLLGPEGDPILATWSVGLGRVGAFTSDLKDRWGAAWTSFPGASRMMGQLGRDLSRKADDPRVRLSATVENGELSVRAEVVGEGGRASSFRRLTAVLGGPGGFREELALEPLGAGSYTAKVPVSRPGAYVVTAKDEATAEVVGTTGAVLSRGEELQRTGTDRALLSRIASMTGGKLRDSLAGIFHDRPKPRFTYLPLLPSLMVFAALSLLLSVAARRLSIPERALAWMQKRPPAAVSSTSASKTESSDPGTLTKLIARKAKAATPVPPPMPPPASKPAPARKPAPMPKPAPPSPEAIHESPLQPSDNGASYPSRPLTAAEILLARRKGRKP